MSEHPADLAPSLSIDEDPGNSPALASELVVLPPEAVEVALTEIDGGPEEIIYAWEVTIHEGPLQA